MYEWNSLIPLKTDSLIKLTV